MLNIKKDVNGRGIVPKTASEADSAGELEVISTNSNKLQYHNGTTSSAVVTEAHTATLTNKSYDANGTGNSLTNVETADLASGVLNTSTSLVGASDTQIPSALAVKTYVDDSSGAVQDDVDDLITLSGVAANATDLGTFTGTTIPDNSDNKEAFQALETAVETNSTNLTNHISDVADAHAASAITNTPSGNLVATTVQGALNELQTDVDGRQATITGAATTITSSDLTVSRAVISNASGKVAVSTVTDTELGYVSGVTSAIQTQLNAKTDEVGGSLTSGSVITPIRSDAKQDTKANLETYAATASNGQLVFATDEKLMYQVVDSALVSVGANTGTLDTVFQLIGDDVANWSTGNNATFLGGGVFAGTFVADSSTPLQGLVSYLDTQAGGSLNDYMASPTQAVDLRFRGQECTLFFPYTYNGSNNDIRVVFYDDTNNAEIPSSAYIQASTTVGIFKTNIVIPSTCESIIVGFQTAVLNSGKIFEFDSVQLTSDTTVYANQPNITSWQSYTPTFTGFGTAASIEFQWRQNGQNVDIRGKFASGTPTAVEARITLPNSYTSGNTTLIPTIQFAGLGVISAGSTPQYNILIEPSVAYMTLSRQASGSAGLTKITGSGILGAGDTLSFTASVPINGLQASNTNILTAPDTFSTDTAPLAYAGSGIYTPTTLPNAPIGTFITHTYAALGNTSTQTTTAPTQTTSDMALNGILLTGRAVSALSTAAAPCRFDIQIGKGLKGDKLLGFASTSKNDPIAYDYRPGSTTLAIQSGTDWGYDPDTGVYTINAGTDGTTLSTTRNVGVRPDTAAAAASGYFTITASKNPALTGLNINAVAARGVQTGGQSIPDTTSTTVVYDATKTYDTHSALDNSTGIFTAPETGFYQASWGLLLANSAGWAAGEVIDSFLQKNGANYARGYYHEVEAATTTQMSTLGSSGVYLIKGETVNIQIQQTSGGAITLLTSTGSNYFSIHKTSVG
jgi:hypothetical protein